MAFYRFRYRDNNALGLVHDGMIEARDLEGARKLATEFGLRHEATVAYVKPFVTYSEKGCACDQCETKRFEAEELAKQEARDKALVGAGA